MASTIVASTLKITIEEDITLNGVQQGGVNTLSIDNVNEIFLKGLCGELYFGTENVFCLVRENASQALRLSRTCGDLSLHKNAESSCFVFHTI